MTESVIKISQSSSQLKMMKDYTSTEKQGIVTILGSDNEIPKNTASSLRRTLSADMSSKKWLNHHGFSSIKKIFSSQRFSLSIADSSSSSSSSEGEEEEDSETEKKRDFDIWNSILSQKKTEEAAKSIPIPYIHPLSKKPTSYLSEKSLEICTESLGSETGSDGFSSETDEDVKKNTFLEDFEWKPVKFGYKKSAPKSFPPPIPSLGCRGGDSVRVQSRRENGRLILDAVSLPSRNKFRADRRNGRLVLSLIKTQTHHHDEEEEKELEIVKEKDEKLSNSVMNFHRLAMMMKKPNGRNLNSLKEDDALKVPSLLSQSLPPRPPKIASPPPLLTAAAVTATATATAAASLNAYEYDWRSKPTMKANTIQNSISQQQSHQPIKFPNNSMAIKNRSQNRNRNQNQQVLVLRGNQGDYWVPLSNGCKVSRRSLLPWEPNCIATT